MSRSSQRRAKDSALSICIQLVAKSRRIKSCENFLGFIPDNDRPVYKDPDYEPHVPSDLLDASFWCHIRPALRSNGRVTKVAPSESDREDNEEGEEEQAEEVVFVHFFSPFFTHLCCFLLRSGRGINEWREKRRARAGPSPI